MKKVINLVQDWREKFGLKINGNGTKEEIKLSNKLIIEEYKELLEAYVDENEIEQLDALGDLIFVLIQKANMFTNLNNITDEIPFDQNSELNNTIVMALKSKNYSSVIYAYTAISLIDYMLWWHYGVDIKELITEIYNSNMSKLCTSKDIAIKTANHYKTLNIDTYYLKKDDFFIVYNKETNKVLKSIDFKKPDLKRIYEEGQNRKKSFFRKTND